MAEDITVYPAYKEVGGRKLYQKLIDKPMGWAMMKMPPTLRGLFKSALGIERLGEMPLSQLISEHTGGLGKFWERYPEEGFGNLRMSHLFGSTPGAQGAIELAGGGSLDKLGALTSILRESPGLMFENPKYLKFLEEEAKREADIKKNLGQRDRGEVQTELANKYPLIYQLTYGGNR